MPIEKQFEMTLRDLGTDYIDVFLWKQDPDIEKISKGRDVDLMLKWKSQGKIKYCGVTLHENQPLLQYLASSDIYDVAVVAFNYNSPPTHIQAVEEAAKKGVGIIAMKTQSPNYNLQKEDGSYPIGDAPDHREALSWVLRKSYITAAIPGMTTREQVDLDIQVMRQLAHVGGTLDLL